MSFAAKVLALVRLWGFAALRLRAALASGFAGFVGCDGGKMPSIEFSVPELAEISDAISSTIRRTLAGGDMDGHEKKYGTLTLLQEAQAKILPVAFGYAASDTSWAASYAEQIKTVRRVVHGLPDEATDGERAVWADTLSKR